jgi:hypothetical protein
MNVFPLTCRTPRHATNSLLVLMFELALIVIIIALVFDFLNGFS